MFLQVKTLSKIVFDCGNDSLNELEKDQNIFMDFQNAATILNCLDQFFHDFCVALFDGQTNVYEILISHTDMDERSTAESLGKNVARM